MPCNPYIRDKRDYAALEKRYAKLLKIAALAAGDRREAIRELLNEFDREEQVKEHLPDEAGLVAGGGRDETAGVADATSVSRAQPGGVKKVDCYISGLND